MSLAGSGARRELRRLERQLAVDRLRVQRTRAGLVASVRRTAARPGTLIAAFATGMLATAALTGRTRRSRLAAPSRPRRLRVATLGAAFRLARTALRVWSRSTVAQEMLSPVLESLIAGRRRA